MAYDSGEEGFVWDEEDSTFWLDIEPECNCGESCDDCDGDCGECNCGEQSSFEI